jgi:hypothetical protein
MTNVMKLACLLLQSLLGDSVIVRTSGCRAFSFPLLTRRIPKIWRLYVVYGKRIWIILPAIVLVLAYTGAMTSILVMIMLLVSSHSQRLVLLPSGLSYMRVWALTFSTWQRRGLPLTSPLRWSQTYSARVSPFILPLRILFPHGPTRA